MTAEQVAYLAASVLAIAGAALGAWLNARERGHARFVDVTHEEHRC